MIPSEISNSFLRFSSHQSTKSLICSWYWESSSSVSYQSRQSSVVLKCYDWCAFLLTSKVRCVQREQKRRKHCPLGGTRILTNCDLLVRQSNIHKNTRCANHVIYNQASGTVSYCKYLKPPLYMSRKLTLALSQCTYMLLRTYKTASTSTHVFALQANGNGSTNSSTTTLKLIKNKHFEHLRDCGCRSNWTEVIQSHHRSFLWHRQKTFFRFRESYVETDRDMLNRMRLTMYNRRDWEIMMSRATLCASKIAP